MRLLLLSDLHGHLQQMEWIETVAGEFDAVVFSGDLLDQNGHRDLGEQRTRSLAFLARISRRAPVLCATGNHDVDPGTGDASWLYTMAGPRLFVDGSTVVWNELAVTLWPWNHGGAAVDPMTVPRFRHARLASTWLWVHHAPPADSRVSRVPPGKPEGGCRRLSGLIRRHRPTLVLSGHLHEAPYLAGGRWWDRIGDTIVLNPGHQHGDVPAHIILDLDAGELSWVAPTCRDDLPLPRPVGLAGVA